MIMYIIIIIMIIIINIHSDTWPCLYSSKAKQSVPMHICSMLCSDIDLKKITHSVIHVCCCSKEKKKNQIY